MNPMRTTRPIAVAAVALLALAACGADVDETTEPSPQVEPPTAEAPTDDDQMDEPTDETTDPEPTEDGETPSEDLTGGAGDDDGTEVDALVDSLADDQGVGPDAVEIIVVEEVTWSDGSIGCPEPGQSYTQALVDGSRVVLAVDGEEFHYHSGADGDLFYCADPVPPSESGGATQ